ncbi:rhodanese-like domain-containing protein 6 isoform X2 [Euphorbia lathyris]|uniref:rhodanese-like domain-containing protein 6 isoform X2 n=1 Tax=Euphorbia lathyris TaxID=212925 RepID=UPI00331361FD
MATDQDQQHHHQNNDEYGVLLYYKYALIPDLTSLLSFYQSNCTSLSLLGRVRLSPNGVNVTVGGILSSLEKHIAAVQLISLFGGTDFKLASSHYPLDDKVAQESGFTSLSIRIVKELVTFSPFPLLNPPDVSSAGKHLSAVEFHSVLQRAHQENAIANGELVLLDARNLYETRIGKFDMPNVETLDPEIRQYSDLSSWIDDNTERLRGKNVLMYCTGGIRCEMASAYIRSKGSGFENVFQLYGGIQRYLEQFPDGGFFKGKNFVFDHRISVGSSDPNVLGNCLLCGMSFDDYSSRCRCSYCRMLVLVCPSCQKKEAAFVCELCQKHGKIVGSAPASENGISETMPGNELKCISSNDVLSCQMLQGQGANPPRKLRILCLHGFRQNASGFKGRTGSLAKKLKSIAELVFVDAPHELPFIYQPCFAEPKPENAASLPIQDIPPKERCNRKFAWLIARDAQGRSETDWKVADSPFDPLQYQHQTEGFDESLVYLKTVFHQQGPFDGILGFSQGAAVTASVCALKERLKNEIDFRFAILCSGFSQRMEEIERGSINCPSLHIFGSCLGKDRQIANEASRDLACLFEEGSSVIIEHDFGHIIPTRVPYIDQIRGFLQRFI